MFKAIGRIGTDKVKFEVVVRPVSLVVYTNAPFDFKLLLRRGKQRPDETKPYKVTQSMKQTDLKTIQFDPSQTFSINCTYFIKDGAPEEKSLTFQLIKMQPGGQEVQVAEKEVNLSMHFGSQFEVSEDPLELARGVNGLNIKKFTYEAVIKMTNKKDRAVYDQCVDWRLAIENARLAKKQIEEEEKKALTQSMIELDDGGDPELRAAQAAALSASMVETAPAKEEPKGFRQKLKHYTVDKVINVGESVVNAAEAVTDVFKDEKSPSEMTVQEKYALQIKGRLETLRRDTEENARKIADLQEAISEKKGRNLELKSDLKIKTGQLTNFERELGDHKKHSDNFDRL